MNEVLSATPMRSRPIFIVGSPRSGTTWLARALNARSDVCAVGEARLGALLARYGSEDVLTTSPSKAAVLGWIVRSGLDSTLALANAAVSASGMQSQGLLCHTLREDLAPIADGIASRSGGSTAAELVDQFFAEIAKREGKAIWCEKTPESVLHLSTLMLHFPAAYVICLTRDPEDYLRSYKNQGRQLDQDTRRRHLARYHPFGAMLVWSKARRAMLRARRVWPEQVSVFNLSQPGDDLLAFNSCLVWTGANPLSGRPPLASDRVNSSVGAGGESVRDLDAAERAWIWLLRPVKLRERLADRYGWRALFSPAFLKSLLRLAPWSLGALSDLAKHHPAPLRRIAELTGVVSILRLFRGMGVG